MYCVVCKHPERLLMESLYLQGGAVSKIVDRFGGFTYPTFYRHCREGGISEEVHGNIDRQAELIERDARKLLEAQDVPQDDDDKDSLISMLRVFHEQTFNDAVIAEDAMHAWELLTRQVVGDDEKGLAKMHREKIPLVRTVQEMKIAAIKTLLESIKTKAINNYLQRNGAEGDALDVSNFQRLQKFTHLSNIQSLTPEKDVSS